MLSARRIFDKLDLAPAYRKVADVIAQMIGSGKLKLGDWLPIEAELADQFGVNRSTIREGLRALEHEGLVRRDGKRLRVAIPHYGELASRASRALVMHQITFRQMWEASSALESITVALASERIGEDGLRALEHNVAEMEPHIDDTDWVVSLDIEFHELLAEAAQNPALSLAREPISLLFYPAGKIILSRLGTQRRILDAHRKILALLVRRDGAGVRQWMERHMADFKRGYERTGISLDRPVDSAADQA